MLKQLKILLRYPSLNTILTGWRIAYQRSIAKQEGIPHQNPPHIQQQCSESNPMHLHPPPKSSHARNQQNPKSPPYQATLQNLHKSSSLRKTRKHSCSFRKQLSNHTEQLVLKQATYARRKGRAEWAHRRYTGRIAWPLWRDRQRAWSRDRNHGMSVMKRIGNARIWWRDRRAKQESGDPWGDRRRRRRRGAAGVKWGWVGSRRIWGVGALPFLQWECCEWGSQEWDCESVDLLTKIEGNTIFVYFTTSTLILTININLYFLKCH